MQSLFAAFHLDRPLVKSACGEGSGSVVDCLTRDRRATGSSLTGVIALCPWARHINPNLVLVQTRKTRLCITERLLMGCKESNQRNKQKCMLFFFLNQQHVYREAQWLRGARLLTECLLVRDSLEALYCDLKQDTFIVCIVLVQPR